MLPESRMGRWATLLLGAVCALTACHTGLENRRPIAAFDAAPLTGTAPLTVAFDASASRDPDGIVLTYGWDLGDGSVQDSVRFEHTFEAPGDFVVRLHVNDEWGAHHAVTRTIQVTPIPATISGAIEVVLEPRVTANEAQGSAPVIPGEWIVQFAAEPSALASGDAWLHDGRVFTVVRPLGLPGALLLRTEPTDAAETAALAAALSTRADVAFAEPNHRVEAFRIPNDPRYLQQWSLPAIGLPHAWEVTTGSPQTVVAVVDTGILHDRRDEARTHPARRGRVLPGFDFIADARVADDGGGRDDDPVDPRAGGGGQST
jgi:PKD repeat protein